MNHTSLCSLGFPVSFAIRFSELKSSGSSLMQLLGGGAPCRVVQSPIKLTQDKRKYWFEFCNLAVGFSVYNI